MQKAVIVSAAVLGVALCSAGDARASSCSAALARYNEESHEQNIQAGLKYRALLGTAMPQTYDAFPYTASGCPGIIAYSNWRIPLQEKLISLQNAVYATCPRAWEYSGARDGAMTSPGSALLARMKSDVVKCQGIIAAAKSPPPPVAITPTYQGGQSADCSDITRTRDTSTSTRDCAPRSGAPQVAARQPEQKPVPPQSPAPSNAPPPAAGPLSLIDQLGKTEEVANVPGPATPPTMFVRPPTHTALDQELRREMEQLQISEPTDCDKSLNATKKDIEEKILKLQKQEPRWEPAPQVEVGTCTSRLHKLFGHGFGLSDTSIAKQVENREARGCLELKKAYLERACECASKGIALSTDEAIQDQTLEAASGVRDLETRARNRGIPNEHIRAIVEKAAEIRDCYNIQTIETLRSADQALERELGLSSGQSSPPASLPLNKPQ